MTINLITATHTDFELYIGDSFIVSVNEAPITLILDNIKLFSEDNIRDNHLEIQGVVYPPRRPFSLTFVGPPRPILAESMYTLKHETIRELELFISAFRQDHDGILYESVFN